MGMTVHQRMQDASRNRTQPRIPSKIATRIYDELKAMPPGFRSDFYATLQPDDFAQLLRVSDLRSGTRYGLWDDDPVGFSQIVLGEAVWSGQKRLMEPLARPNVRRVFSPAGFSLGKTHGAADIVCWAACTRPVGMVKIPTIATRFRQVQRQLWPHIRRLHAQAQLPGSCDIVQWKMPDRHGIDVDVAYGFSAPPWDESALQGIHAPWQLLVVDEAGGISHTLGQATRGLLSGNARMLAIGNPPTDVEGSWFETGVADGLNPDKPDTVTVRLAAWDSPAITGEYVVCRACPPSMPRHSLGTHLVDQAWIDEAIAEHGRDAPWVKSKIDAEFSKGGASLAIPSDYVDAAVEAMQLGAWWGPEHTVPGAPSVDKDGTPYPVQPSLGAVVDLGVDVASDGGDELVLARREGDIVRLVHIQSGHGLDDAVKVAGIIAEHIRRASVLATALGSRRVQVKVDAIGVGWGICGTLEAWSREGIIDATIVRVVASETPDKPDDTKATWRPANKRAEMWFNGRELFKPESTGLTPVRLAVDTRTMAQLRAPRYYTRSDGRMLIEKKSEVNARLGGSNSPGKSPDRADAVLLALYQPTIMMPARLF